nr:MAG TPA: hypothetical protein [Caudoviricetes sp.]
MLSIDGLFNDPWAAVSAELVASSKAIGEFHQITPFRVIQGGYQT